VTAWRWSLQRLREVAELFRLAVKLPLAAPFIFALVAVPEFVQHVVEIHLGMFAVGDTVAPGRETDIRTIFGIIKVVALCLGIMLTLRFWTSGGKLHAALLPGRAQIRQLALVFAVFLVTGLPGLFLEAQARRIFDIVSGFVTMFGLLWFFAALAGVEMSLARSARRTIPNLPRMVILLPAAWMPLAWLHYQLHLIARHQAEWLVWGLMTVDALVVGLLAAAAGAALFILIRSADDSKPGLPA
jgi:hypothetical protein